MWGYHKTLTQCVSNSYRFLVEIVRREEGELKVTVIKSPVVQRGCHHPLLCHHPVVRYLSLNEANSKVLIPFFLTHSCCLSFVIVAQINLRSVPVVDIQPYEKSSKCYTW